jgi:hypothetical protein
MRVGETIFHYRVVEPIGAGVGVVYKASRRDTFLSESL